MELGNRRKQYSRPNQCVELLCWPLRLFPPKMRGLVVLQFWFTMLLFFLWTYANGGVKPKLWTKQLHQKQVLSKTDVLRFFSENAGTDASNITWCFALSKEELDNAVKDKCMVLSTDVVIAKDVEPPTPVIGQYVGHNTNLKFEDFVERAFVSGKAVQFNFLRDGAIVPGFEFIKSKRHWMKSPLWLGGDILPGPNIDEKSAILPIDAKQFTSLATKMFPDATLVLGWTTSDPRFARKGGHGYTWSDVLKMYKFIMDQRLKQPIVISARAILMQYSVPPIRWLCDAIEAKVLVWDHANDRAPLLDLLYVRTKFPTTSAFFTLGKSQHEFEKYKDKPDSIFDSKTRQATGNIFSSSNWDTVTIDDGDNEILLGNEAVMLTGEKCQLVHELHSVVMPSKPVTIDGLVHFVVKDKATVTDTDGLDVFLRTKQPNSPHKVNGIKCHIGVKGTMEISSHNLPGVTVLATKKVTPSYYGSCYGFSITDFPGRITMYVKVYADCERRSRSTDSDRTTVKVTLPKTLSEDDYSIVVRVNSKNIYAAIEEFIIR